MEKILLMQANDGDIISLVPDGTKFRDFRKFYMPCSKSLPVNLHGQYLVTSENVSDLVLDPTLRVYRHNVKEWQPSIGAQLY
jgi:hypothetical protein